LSTPAATNVHVDETLPDDAMAKLTADFPPLSLIRDASMFRTAIFDPPQSTNPKTGSGPEGMELDEPFRPDQTSYRRRHQVEAIATTDPDPNGVDYSSHGILSGMRLSQGSIDPSAYIMNLAAPATIFQDHVPSVVDPSAVSLHSFTQDSEVLTGSAEPTSTNGSQKLESFAKIEFADSTFQMTTYTVIIGRDQQAMEQARADERREAAYRRKCEENERNGFPPPTPIMYDRNKFSKSYVSEEGGMLGPEHSDGEQDVKPLKKRRPSSAVPSQTGEENASGDHVQSNRQYVSHTPGAAAVDLGVLQTSPEHIPFIGIHSPGPDIASKTRGISRQHLKIQFNKKRGVFEGIALHKNGFFCEDVLYGLDKPATLKSGDRLQIKDVEFFFVINGVQLGMSGGEDEDAASSKRMSVGGKEISLDFEHSDHENFRDTSEELSDVENIPTPTIESEHGGQEGPGLGPEPELPLPSQSQPQPQPDPDPELTAVLSLASEEHQLPEAVKTEADMLPEMPSEIGADFAMPDIPRRRGPGRPPKDGIMSKRERRLLKKQLQETSKKTLPQDSQEEKIKRPVGRPRKNPLPEDGEREKRKYNKKKREDGEEGSDVEKRVKEKKDKKVRPKSPPLDLRIEDYTPEQLQKPTKNYGVLIDEALTNGPPDGLTLKQIYKRITARYPWFYFTAETKGWESSVRHNLIGNEAFKKDEETSLWSRVPGVELDAGKKRKASSPDRILGPSHLHSHLSHSPYYQSSPYATPGSVTYTHGLPSYSTEQKHPQPSFPSTGQNAQLHVTPSQPVTQPAYPAHTPAPAQLPPGYGSLALPRPSNPPQQSTYSSPYARPPPPPTNPPVKPDATVVNGQAPTTSSTAQSVAPVQQHQSRPSGAPVANVVPREQLSPEIEKAIEQFSNNMLQVISKQTPHAARIIEAAANRIRGLPVHNRVPGFDSVETTLINAMQGMIADMKSKHRHTTSASPAPNATVRATPTPSPAPPNTVEAEIQRRLKNFRESMVTALKTKTDKAEIIVDSAINRARGLPHAGKIPGWEEADNLMVKSVTQIIAEARNAYSLKLQTASPVPANTSRTPTTQATQAAQAAQSIPRAEPSASPASAQTPISSAAPGAAAPMPPSNGMPTASHTTAVQPLVSTVPNSNIPSMVRPSMPLQRPAPVTLTRPPTTGPMARPTGLYKDSTTATAMTSATMTAPPRPNVSSPAPPSAGVLDQITGHKRFTDDAFHRNNGVNISTSATSNIVPNGTAASNVVNSSGVNAASGGSLSITNTGTMANITSKNAASKAASNTTSNITNYTPRSVTDSTSSMPNNTTSIATSATMNSLPTNAATKIENTSTSSTSISTSNSMTSKPTGVVAGNFVSNWTGKAANNTLSSSPGNLARSMPNNSPGVVASSMPNHLSSVAGSDTAGNMPSSTTGNSGSPVGTSTANSTTCAAASDMSGDTTRTTAGEVTNDAANTGGSRNTHKSVATDVLNHTTGAASDRATGNTTGTTIGNTAGHTMDSTTGNNVGVVTSVDVCPLDSDHISGKIGAENKNSTGSVGHSNVEKEKSMLSKASPGEHRETTAFKAPAPIHNMSSPAPPSAGVVDQIAGHKRSLDEGPGSANAEQPEPKRLGITPV
jgi:hypothetical protein